MPQLKFGFQARIWNINIQLYTAWVSSCTRFFHLRKHSFLSLDFYVESTCWHMANTWTKRANCTGEQFGLESHEGQNKPSRTAQCEVPVACVAAGCQMFIRHDTTDVHLCSGSLRVSQLGTSHLWYMSHGALEHCAQCTSHGCPWPPPLQNAITLNIWRTVLSLRNNRAVISTILSNNELVWSL